MSSDTLSIKNCSSSIDVVLFDMGGVLVQLSGVEAMLGWLRNRYGVEELWRLWLHSPAVRAFETGRIDEQAFATGVIAEFGLPIEPQQFLETFIAWPTGLFPGTLELLARIPRSYRRALLSNCNSLHWARLWEGMGLAPAFDHHFVSHLTGRIKPDRAAFEHVVESLSCKPAQVLFLDDNLLNVEAARQLGMRAARVRGIVEAERALVDAGILAAGES